MARDIPQHVRDDIARQETSTLRRILAVGTREIDMLELKRKEIDKWISTGYTTVGAIEDELLRRSGAPTWVPEAGDE